MHRRWSGQLDFLDNEQSTLIHGELSTVPESQHWENIIIPESQWFNVDENDLYKKLNYVFENKYDIKNKAKGLMYKNREKFTLNKMVQKLDEIMKQYTKDLPQQVSIKLPKLKKSKPKLEETV